METDDSQSSSDQDETFDATAAFEGRLDLPSDLHGNLSTRLPPSPPRPWGFWATWMWAILLGVGMIVAESIATIAYIVVQGTLAQGTGVEFDSQAITAGIRTNGLLRMLCGFANGTMTMILLPPIIWRRRMTIADYLGIDRPGRQQLVVAAILAMAIALVSNVARVASGDTLVPDTTLQIHASVGFVPLLWLMALVVAPVVDEIVFRGFLLAPQGSRIAQVAGLTLSSCIWADMQGNEDWIGFVTNVGAGLVLGTVRLRTGSTTLAIWMHFMLSVISLTRVYVWTFFFA